MLKLIGEIMIQIAGLTNTYSLWDFYNPVRNVAVEEKVMTSISLRD